MTIFAERWGVEKGTMVKSCAIPKQSQSEGGVSLGHTI